MTRYAPTADDGWLPNSRNAEFARAYPGESAAVHHRLQHHPLFALEALADLAERLPGSHVEHSRGDLAVDQDPSAIRREPLSPAEVVRTIATVCCRVTTPASALGAAPKTSLVTSGAWSGRRNQVTNSRMPACTTTPIHARSSAGASRNHAICCSIRDTAVLLSAALTLALSPKSTIHSHLLIQPGKQFLLGGGQAGGFRVTGRNVGPVAVEVLERPRRGPAVARGRLLPGQRVALSFADSSAAVISNASTRQAVLDLTITTSSHLSMTYETALLKINNAKGL